MVKGNADRRRELARLRCEEQRAELERRALGPEFATPAEARARLLSDAKSKGSDESDLFGWVIITSEERDYSRNKSFCESYFRTGVPATRSPDSSNVNLGGLAAYDVTQGCLPAMQPLPLRTCDAGGKMVYDRTVRRAVRQPQILMFIEWEGHLVFDFANPRVYAKYCEREEAKTVAVMQEGVAEVSEGGCSTANGAPQNDEENGASQRLFVSSFDTDGRIVSLVFEHERLDGLIQLEEDKGVSSNAEGGGAAED
ncbi:hypothetical protein CEUSTIGMA_g7467.t1 [Chlamydomonas eustigma]|uniref:Uncharacterized protein n=1 Tax=Chlamydomonas eustigma TaxID=1157962 RepID=A0A250XAC1_9CHLO|nr:hypothetical protein CEUSTIGMA_g7467.t1 [Chlamydomonas eustigma]|eukprot:GAX80028.1 hypothetical protein CEUSTIGMA_g7467.t1 [Chlamydomonas eustigma]